MSQMLSEIQQQPQVLQSLLDRSQEISRLAHAIERFSPDLFVLAGMGSSRHAALFAQYLFTRFLGIPSVLLLPDFPPPRASWRKIAFIAISQSGRAPAVQEAMRSFQKKGNLLISITNEEEGIAHLSHLPFLLRAGKERAVPATKTYTATLLLLLLLAVSLRRGVRVPVHQVPDLVRKGLSASAAMKDQAGSWKGRARGFSLGTGPDLATALEVALKLKEITSVHLDGYGMREFIHGHIAAVQEGVPVIFFRSKEKISSFLLRQLRKRRASLFLLGMNTPPDPLSVFPNTVMGQLLSYHVGIALGKDPDRPEGLRKVMIHP